MTLMEESGCSSTSEVMGLVKAENSKALAALLQTKALPVEELNARDKNGRTCLNCAILNGDGAMVDLLLATEIPDPNIGDKEGNTPLIYAVSAGDSAITTKLLKYETTNIDQANDNGFTALIKAAIHDRLSCVDLLLAAGANADVTDYSRGMNAFQWAQLCASKTCAKTLKRHRPQSSKKPWTNSLKKVKNTDSIEHSSPLRNTKGSPAGVNNNKHPGIETIVACVNASKIPMILADTNPLPTIQLVEAMAAHHDTRASSTRKRSDEHVIIRPKIEITSDTGECIIPNKTFFTPPPSKKHSK